MRRLPLLALATILVGCGGAGTRVPASRFEGKYTASYAVAPGAPEEEIVLDVDGAGRAEGSVAAGGSVYDFAGRVAGDGTLTAGGEGIEVRASLVRREGELTGPLTLSDGTGVRHAQPTFRPVPATE